MSDSAPIAQAMELNIKPHSLRYFDNGDRQEDP